MDVSHHHKNIWQRIDWPVTLFLVLNPIIGILAAIFYYTQNNLDHRILFFSIAFAAATNLSITAGYHRLFSHRSYEAHPIVRFLFLLIGASAFQGSALKWSADHRIHHSKVDTDLDPYSINKGFWYAHMGWLFLKDSTDHNPKAADLEKDWMVVLQHKYYVLFAFLSGFIFPTIVGAFFGHPFEGFLVGGALRIALTQQSTFFVNSLCHTLGKKTYSDKISARDSFIVALLTHGEGYHNFHHHFQLDYRNGIRWYQWDPTKWTIRTLAFLGLAKKLKRISAQEILKARLQMESIRLVSKGFSADLIEQMKEKVLVAQSSLKKLQEEYELKRKEFSQSSQEKFQESQDRFFESKERFLERKAQLQLEIHLKKIELESAINQWKLYLKFAPV